MIENQGKPCYNDVIICYEKLILTHFQSLDFKL